MISDKAIAHELTRMLPDMSGRIATVVLFAILALAILVSVLYSPGDRCLDVGSTMCMSVLGAQSVSIAPSALRELHDRMARFDCLTGICITGPFAEDSRAPASIEEAWLLERIYGPPQRWVLSIVPLNSLAKQPTEPGETLYIDKVSGMFVGVLTTKTALRLSVELYGDAIRVHELDA